MHDGQEIETISISNFKATCLAVLETVRRTGQPIVVTKHGKPIATITPPQPERPRRWLGCLSEHGKIVGDVVSPAVSSDTWEALDE